MQWEWADPPWKLPTYVSDFVWDLLAMKTWIMNGGIAEPMTVGPPATAPLTNPGPLAVSEGKSEVGASNKELLSLQSLVSKVQ